MGIPPIPPSAPFKIKQLDSDPSSPRPQQAWVKHSLSAGGGGKIVAMGGLGSAPVTTVGTTTHTYQLSYRTLEGTTKRVTLT